MVTIKTPEDIEKLREGGKILASILLALKDKAKGGVSAQEMEHEARRLTEEAGAKPAFLGYTPEGGARPFPSALCLSINNEVVHGIPSESKYILKDGDLATIDMGISYKGMIVDSAITVGVGGVDKVDDKGKMLLEAGALSLEAAIELCENWTQVKGGVKTGDIGAATENSVSYYVKKYGFNFAENLGGHGVGYHVHEDPFIPNFARKGQGVLLQPGMVIAIEPILNEGSGKINLLDNDYIYVTSDGKRSVHFEHTILITEEGAEVLTAFDQD